MRFCVTLLALVGLTCSTVCMVDSASAQQTANIEPTIASRAAQLLAGRRVAPPPPRKRGAGLRELYLANVHNVPLVVSQEGTGSSVVIKVSPNGQALLVTNNHVVKQSFERNGHPVVLLLFYDAALKDEYFDSQKFFACWASSPDQSAWCQAVRKSSRVANVLSTDPARDLALVGVDNVPAGVTAIPVGDIANLGPGDSVAIIGNPEDLLWSLTTGIISAVRKNFPIGTGSGTVIQTQAPVNPGNSGGPLMELDGKLAGVVFATAIGASADLPSAEGTRQLVVPAPGLNYAIGVDQVLAFTASVRQ